MDTLVIDVGNTRIQWRLRRQSGELLEEYTTPDSLSASLKSHLGESGEGLRVAVSCLRQDQRSALSSILQSTISLPVLWIDNGAAEQVAVETEYPEKTGADRALAALAWGDRHGDVPAVVIDAGTAVTVDAVSGDGVLLGGWITAGWQSLKSSLASAAPELPHEISSDDSSPWARETSLAIGGGLETLYRSGIVALHSRVLPALQELSDQPVLTVLTGGDSVLLQSEFPDAILIPGLVLDGLESALARAESGQD